MNENTEKIKQIFNQFDKDKSGYINKNELASLSIALNDPLSNAELHDFFRDIDEDNSGKISWEEFIKYWTMTAKKAERDVDECKNDKRNDKRNGHGTMTYTDGGEYVGEFKNDKRNSIPPSKRKPTCVGITPICSQCGLLKTLVVVIKRNLVMKIESGWVEKLAGYVLNE